MTERTPEPETTPYEPPRHTVQRNPIDAQPATPEACAADYATGAMDRALMDKRNGGAR